MTEEGYTTVLHVCNRWYNESDHILFRNLHDVISKGASVNEREPVSGDTPLHLAAGFGSSDLVRELVSLGADVNATNALGITPLEECSASHTARTLILLGADISLKRKFELATFAMLVTVSDYQKRFAHCRKACRSLWRILRLHRPGLASRDMAGVLEAAVWATRFDPAWESPLGF